MHSKAIMSTTSFTYQNTHTFLYEQAVETLQPTDLLVLDGYAFNVSELEQRLTTCPDQVFLNPHNDQLFSEIARQVLRNHSSLGSLVCTAEALLNTYPISLTPSVEPGLYHALPDSMLTYTEGAMPANLSQMLSSTAFFSSGLSLGEAPHFSHPHSPLS